MGEIQLVSSAVIYRNPHPGHAVINAYLPSTIELKPGELVCVLRRGSAFYSHDGVLVPFRSTDGGTTWIEGSPVRDPRQDQQLYSYTAPFLSQLRDGSLVLVAFRFEASDRLFVNPQTGAFLPCDTLLFRSQDGGLSWSLPEVARFPGRSIAYPSGCITELPGGGWFLPLDLGKAYDDPKPFKPEVLCSMSHDCGRSWSAPIQIAAASCDAKSYRHGRVVPLLDGRLFTLLWTEDVSSRVFIDLHRTISDVEGCAWSTPEPTGLPGQTSWAVDLGGGRMFAAYSLREENPPGIRGVISEDVGKTWSKRSEIVLWDATGRETIGVASRSQYPWSHDVIAFGRPQAHRLADGDILISFWATEACTTQAFFRRVRCHF